MSTEDRLREAERLLLKLSDKMDSYRKGYGFVGADLLLTISETRAFLADSTPAQSDGAEALAPFARLAEELPNYDPVIQHDFAPVWAYGKATLTFGDFRAALSAYRKRAGAGDVLHYHAGFEHAHERGHSGHRHCLKPSATPGTTSAIAGPCKRREGHTGICSPLNEDANQDYRQRAGASS